MAQPFTCALIIRISNHGGAAVKINTILGIMVALKIVLFALTGAIATVRAVRFTPMVFLKFGCVHFTQTNSGTITVFFFNNNTDTLELYVGARSGYTAGSGSSNVPDNKYASYKVYSL